MRWPWQQSPKERAAERDREIAELAAEGRQVKVDHAIRIAQIQANVDREAAELAGFKALPLILNALDRIAKLLEREFGSGLVKCPWCVEDGLPGFPTCGRAICVALEATGKGS